MSTDQTPTLEARIAGVLAASDIAHSFKKAEQMGTDYPHFWCSCGVQTIGRGKFPEHVRQAAAAALAPMIAQAQAEALREAADSMPVGWGAMVWIDRETGKVAEGIPATWLRARADKLVTL